MTLEGKTAVITGASSGIGAAVARNLREAGVNLVLTGRRAARLQELIEELGQGVAIAAELEDPELPAGLLSKSLETYGACDIVFNNAGLIEVGKIEEVNIEKVCRMVRVNVEAAFRMAYTALKHFKAKCSGHLVNTSSILGVKVRPTAGAYAGTKFAIEALSEALRMEVAGTEIQVSCIEPGLVDTELHRDWATHPKEMFGISRPLTPEDIARGVRFLLEQPPHVRVPRLMMLPGEHSI